VPRCRALAGRLASTDFDELIRASGALAHSPLTLLDARSEPVPGTDWISLADRGYAGLVFCDTAPTAAELSAWAELTRQRRSVLLFPRVGPAPSVQVRTR
jgi:hypothetical protein